MTFSIGGPLEPSFYL